MHIEDPGEYDLGRVLIWWINKSVIFDDSRHLSTGIYKALNALAINEEPEVFIIVLELDNVHEAVLQVGERRVVREGQRLGGVAHRVDNDKPHRKWLV